ncbi:MAG: O-antigen ligase family protein [Ardenticatenaceae bacterium]
MTWKRLAIMAFYALWILVFWLLWHVLVMTRYEVQRGVWFPGDALPPSNESSNNEASTPLGTTVELTQYESDQALAKALDAAQAMGIGWLRQELPWDQLEPAPGGFDWAPWDRVIGAAHERGFEIVLVLNRTPRWARRDGELHNPFAPPLEIGDFAYFARLAAERYGDKVLGWQVWDEPNLSPHWGVEVTLDPNYYADFLAAVTPAIRLGDRDAIVALGALGPTSELRGYNMSEVRFLQGLYEAKADDYFDAVAVKPYGFGYDAQAPVYSEDTLNFNRVVLVREMMARNGDSQTPIWLVEGGWGVLPPDWEGDPPPWGSDGPEIQQFRLRAAIKRAALEWPWAQVIALQLFQPNVPNSDPHRSLALFDEDGSPTALGKTTAELGNLFFNGPVGEQERGYWEEIARPNLLRYKYAIWMVVIIMTLLTGRFLWHSCIMIWGVWGPLFRRLPEWAQMSALAAIIMLFYQADDPVTSLAFYSLLMLIVSWRLDLGLMAVAFAIPFFLQVKWFAMLQFSMVELLILPCVLVWFVHGLLEGTVPVEKLLPLRENTAPSEGQLFALQEKMAFWRRSWYRGLISRLSALFWPQDALDWAIACFTIWGALSLSFADTQDVATREFRVVVSQSAMWFWLIRRSRLSMSQRFRLVDVLVASAVVVAVYGLYQWFFTANIITAEGVRRIRGVYGSPNNLALMLERIVPIVGALLLLAPDWRRRVLYAVAAVPLILCLFLTFSRGAWLLGLPTALLWLGWWGGPVARKWTIRVALVGVMTLIPFVGTERFASTLNFEGGTWYIRFRLWEATWDMLRDFPILGVGLDNFLYVYDAYRLPEAWREPDLSHPHQIFLHFWVALGIPGLLLLFWQQGAFWRKWRQLSQYVPKNSNAWGLLIGLGASMAATLAHGMIDNSYFLVDLAFIWMMTLALVAEFERA